MTVSSTERAALVGGDVARRGRRRRWVGWSGTGRWAGRSATGRRAGRVLSFSSPGALREAGMATAEYAIATLAACGFAGLLLALLRGGEVRELLMGIIRRALAVG
jgi:hypothetical protein